MQISYKCLKVPRTQGEVLLLSLWMLFRCSIHCVGLVSFVVVVQLLRHVWLFATPWTAACQASLQFTISWSLLKPMSIKPVMPSNHLILCCSLLLPSVFPSLRVFSMSWLLHQVAKVLELQLQHQSFQWIFRVDFLQEWLAWSPCSQRDSCELSHLWSSNRDSC